MTDQRGLTDNDVVIITSFGGTQATLSVAFPDYDELSREIHYSSKEELEQKIGADILEFKNDYTSKIFTVANDGEDVTLNDSLSLIVSDTFNDVKKGFKSRFKDIRKKAEEVVKEARAEKKTSEDEPEPDTQKPSSRSIRID